MKTSVFANRRVLPTLAGLIALAGAIVVLALSGAAPSNAAGERAHHGSSPVRSDKAVAFTTRCGRSGKLMALGRTW